MKLKTFLLNYKWQLVGTGIGLLGGYLYWFYIGCTSGTCPIQANWHTSTLYGGIMGYLLSDLRKKPKKEKEEQSNGEV